LYVTQTEPAADVPRAELAQDDAVVSHAALGDGRRKAQSLGLDPDQLARRGPVQVHEQAVVAPDHLGRESLSERLQGSEAGAVDAAAGGEVDALRPEARLPRPVGMDATQSDAASQEHEVHVLGLHQVLPAALRLVETLGRDAEQQGFVGVPRHGAHAVQVGLACHGNHLHGYHGLGERRSILRREAFRNERDLAAKARCDGPAQGGGDVGSEACDLTARL
jgi:hypothetical protein